MSFSLNGLPMVCCGRIAKVPDLNLQIFCIVFVRWPGSSGLVTLAPHHSYSNLGHIIIYRILQIYYGISGLA